MLPCEILRVLQGNITHIMKAQNIKNQVITITQFIIILVFN